MRGVRDCRSNDHIARRRVLHDAAFVDLMGCIGRRLDELLPHPQVSWQGFRNSQVFEAVSVDSFQQDTSTLKVGCCFLWNTSRELGIQRQAYMG